MRMISAARDALVASTSNDAVAQKTDSFSAWLAAVPQSWRLGLAIFFGVVVLWAVVRKAIGLTVVGLFCAGGAALWYLFATV